MQPTLTSLVSLQTDILRQIFDFLDDKDLFSLLDVCHLTRTLGLVVLLMRYRAHIDWNEEVSLASPAATELQENAMTICKLNCQFEDLLSLTVLKKIFVLLPNVEWLRVELSQDEQEANKNGGPIFLSIILRFLKRTRSYGRLVIVDPGGIPRTVTQGESVGEIRHSLEQISDCDSITLQSFLHRAWFSSKCTLVVPNHLHVTQLMIGYADFRGAWATTIMPLLQLPALLILHITKKTRMNTADLFAFLSRHPTIVTFTLEHYSLARSDVAQDRGPWPLPSLITLTAPLPYLPAILKDINLVRRLKSVTIGVSPEEEVITPLHRRLFPIPDAFDEIFSFITLNEVLCTLGDSEIISLELVVPAGVAAKEWLTLGEDPDERPERRLTHVKILRVYPETDRRIPDSIIRLFGLWSELFPSMTSYRIQYHGRRPRW
jgi:hypothetical protein